MLTLRDVMTSDPVTVSPDMTLRDAMRVLVARRVSGAPVVDGRQVVGVVSATDIADFASSLPGVPTERELVQPDEWEPAHEWEEGAEPPATYFVEMWDDAGADVEERLAEDHSPEWDPLEEYTVSEVMTPHARSLPPDAPLTEAADYMKRAGIHRVLVMENGELLGVVSALDLAKAVADGRAMERRPAFDADRAFDERGWRQP